jgi:hypothetical protein
MCSVVFWPLVPRQKLDRRLEQAGAPVGRADIMRDLKALQNVAVEECGRSLLVCITAFGRCGKVFQAADIEMPPSIQEI